MNLYQIKVAAFLDELEKNSSIPMPIKSGISGLLTFAAGLGPYIAPQVVASNMNRPAITQMQKNMEYGKANAREIVKKYDPGVIPLTSQSQLDTAKINPADKAILKYNIDKSGKFKNTYFIPGTEKQRYVATPEFTDTAYIGHELGHAKHYQDSVLNTGGNYKEQIRKWTKVPTIQKETYANKFAPIKNQNYNKEMAPLLNTYKRINKAGKITKKIYGGELAGGIGLGLLAFLKKRKFRL